MSTGYHADTVLNTGRRKPLLNRDGSRSTDRNGNVRTEYFGQKATADHATNGNRRNVSKAKAARASRKANRRR